MWAYVPADRDASTQSRTGSSRERSGGIKTVQLPTGFKNLYIC